MMVDVHGTGTAIAPGARVALVIEARDGWHQQSAGEVFDLDVDGGWVYWTEAGSGAQHATRAHSLAITTPASAMTIARLARG